MKYLLWLMTVLGACGGAPTQQATTVPVCRVVLSDLTWTQDATSPQIIATSARSALVGERETFQFFWREGRQLFRKAPNPPLSYQTYEISTANNAFRVIAHQDKALLVYTEEDKLFMVFGGESDPLTRKLDLGEKRPIESIALAARGKTAVVLYTAQTPQGLQAFMLTVDLCPFFSGDALCYAQEKIDINAETWETTGRFTPTPLGDVDPLSKGALSVASLGEQEFVMGIEVFATQKKTYRLSRTDGDTPFSATEEALLPDGLYPLPGPIPLVSSPEQTFAFYTADTATLQFKELTGSRKGDKIRLRDKGALRRFASVDITYDVSSPKPIGSPSGYVGALWFGPDPFQRGTRQLSFSLFTLNGVTREPAFSVLPGENILVAEMAVLNRANKLSFGVFYQHEDPEIELGFVEIECSK